MKKIALIIGLILLTLALLGNNGELSPNTATPNAKRETAITKLRNDTLFILNVDIGVVISQIWRNDTSTTKPTIVMVEKLP